MYLLTRIVCIKTWYTLFFCAIELHSCPKPLKNTWVRHTVSHWCTFIAMSTHTVFMLTQLITHTPSCCPIIQKKPHQTYAYISWNTILSVIFTLFPSVWWHSLLLGCMNVKKPWHWAHTQTTSWWTGPMRFLWETFHDVVHLPWPKLCQYYLYRESRWKMSNGIRT